MTSFLFTPGHCVDFKTMRRESTHFNETLADTLHHVTLALLGDLATVI